MTTDETKPRRAQLMATEECLRLAHMHGVAHPQDAAKEDARLPEIDTFLQGSIADAWHRCLPEWKTLGRVRDLSHCVRAPMYWQHFANVLGRCFADAFKDDYEFLIQRMDEFPQNSTEYLCICDLLEYMLGHHACESPSTRERFFALKHPLPPVVQLECEASRDYSDHTGSVGQYLRRIFDLEYGETD